MHHPFSGCLGLFFCIDCREEILIVLQCRKDLGCLVLPARAQLAHSFVVVVVVSFFLK